LSELVETVCAAPPLILYVNVYGAVPLAPVKVITGDADPIQTAVEPLMVAVGRGLAVTVTITGVPAQPLAVGVMV
jgi:hypothetical protein